MCVDSGPIWSDQSHDCGSARSLTTWPVAGGRAGGLCREAEDGPAVLLREPRQVRAQAAASRRLRRRRAGQQQDARPAVPVRGLGTPGRRHLLARQDRLVEPVALQDRRGNRQPLPVAPPGFCDRRGRKQGGYIFYAGASLAGAGYCRQCRRRPAILPLQLWQGC